MTDFSLRTLSAAVKHRWKMYRRLSLSACDEPTDAHYRAATIIVATRRRVCFCVLGRNAIHVNHPLLDCK